MVTFPLRDTFWYCWRKKRILVLICTACAWSSPINWAKGKRWNFIRCQKLSLILVLIFYFSEAADTRIILLCFTYYASTSLSILDKHGLRPRFPTGHDTIWQVTIEKPSAVYFFFIEWFDCDKMKQRGHFLHARNLETMSIELFRFDSILIFWLQNRILFALRILYRAV